MGLRGEAAIVGYAQRTPKRHFAGVPRFSLEQWAELAADALADAGIDPREVDGVCVGGDIGEAGLFAPATVAEYCGWSVNFAERLDLGGASSVGMVWRAAAAIELGICEVVVCATASSPRPEPPIPPPADDRVLFGASSNVWGSPQAEFDIPYGNIGQNAGFAMYAQRYHDAFGWNERGRAKIASDQRASACVNPEAVFFGQPLTPDDVLASRVIAQPLHLLEIVMPVTGGAALVITSLDRARKLNRRPVAITGFGEHLTHKTPTYSPSLDVTPIQQAARSTFAMARRTPADVDMVQLYDCYTITVLLTIEDSGFCGKGEGLDFVLGHDLSYAGDFPCNTHGGQLSFGQPGLAGGMSHVVEAVAQIQGRGGRRQVRKHDIAYVSGTGGVMSEQTAVLLEGA
ncbi:MAG TPA: thiolase family protein [Frankiaceae bacterium]|jgi:acetyl-CoA acetyltransferase|nr:thiolase family protein [Frankiaceae bacterium]